MMRELENIHDFYKRLGGERAVYKQYIHQVILTGATTTPLSQEDVDTFEERGLVSAKLQAHMFRMLWGELRDFRTAMGAHTYKPC